jgi:TfoX/Sxy family transcriptional regulator of competence genes
MARPSFAKSPPELVARFRSLTADLPDVERRQMFGYPCLFVGGNMVSGLHGVQWFVRVGEARQAELLAEGAAGLFEVMPGRPMAGYVRLPDAVLDDDEAVRGWVARAVALGRTLPPKASKPAKPARSRRTSGLPHADGDDSA